MRRALTLTELLVALAVVVLLVGLLLPVLGSVREAGMNAQSLSNLRQMAIAASEYATRYGHFPPAVRYENDPFREIAWDFVITRTRDRVTFEPGAIWEFSDVPDRAMLSPFVDPEADRCDDRPVTGYNYNTTYIGGEGRFPFFGWDQFRTGVRLSACRRLAQVALLGEGGKRDCANNFMRAPENTVERDLNLVYAGGQAFRKGRTNIVFLDGHTGSAAGPYRGIHATDRLLDEVLGYPVNGFLSDDDTAYDPR